MINRDWYLLYCLDDYLTKYRYQRDGGRSRDAEIYAEDFNDITFLKEYDNWMNDGQPIPIKNDRDFFDIQKKVWGKVKHHIHCCYSVEELEKFNKWLKSDRPVEECPIL